MRAPPPLATVHRPAPQPSTSPASREPARHVVGQVPWLPLWSPPLSWCTLVLPPKQRQLSGVSCGIAKSLRRARLTSARVSPTALNFLILPDLRAIETCPSRETPESERTNWRSESICPATYSFCCASSMASTCGGLNPVPTWKVINKKPSTHSWMWWGKLCSGKCNKMQNKAEPSNLKWCNKRQNKVEPSNLKWCNKRQNKVDPTWLWKHPSTDNGPSPVLSLSRLNGSETLMMHWDTHQMDHMSISAQLHHVSTCNSMSHATPSNSEFVWINVITISTNNKP